jgi:hypothetical protein
VSELQRQYATYNKKWFNGRLPHDVKVTWSSNIDRGSVAISHPHGFGVCDRTYCPKRCTRPFIRLYPSLKPFTEYWKLCLLHEMVHIEGMLGDKRLFSHGPSFRYRLLQLVEAGAYNGLL